MQCLQEPFVRSLLSYYNFCDATSPFDRRVTCLEWHPTHPKTLAVGSKGGDIFLWDFDTKKKKTFIQGVSSSAASVFFSLIINQKKDVMTMPSFVL